MIGKELLNVWFVHEGRHVSSKLTLSMALTLLVLQFYLLFEILDLLFLFQCLLFLLNRVCLALLSHRLKLVVKLLLLLLKELAFFPLPLKLSSALLLCRSFDLLR